MFFREQNIREPFLMKIAELESHIAQLHRAICTNPQQPIAVTRNLHVGALDKPVWNRAQGHQRLLYQLWAKLLQADELGHGCVNCRPVLGVKLKDPDPDLR